MRVIRRKCARLTVCAVLVWASLVFSVASTAYAQGAPSKGFVSFGFGTQAATKGFTEAWTETVNVEQARYETRYGKKGGGILDVGFGLRVYRQLYLGVALTQTQHRAGADIAASIPHPFFFNRLREATGTASSLRRSEIGAHVQATWRVALGPKLDLAIFGGPSWISLEQDLVDKVTVTEAFPYDTVSFQDASTGVKSGTGIGGHVGVDVTYRVGSVFGVGGQVRFVAANVDVDVATGRTATLKAGGAAATGGVRFFF